MDDEINDTLASQKAKSIYDQFVERYSEDYSVESIEKISVEYSLDNIVESDFFNSQQKPDGIYTPVKNNAFNLNMGEVSISELGESVWIVELAEIIPENKKELDEVKPQIKKFISITKGKDAARIAAEETMKKLNDKKGSFKSSAKMMGLEIKETKYFTRLNPPNYLDQESLKIDAFLLTEENPMSSKIYNRGNNYFIVSLKDKKGVDKKEFEENRELLKQRELAKFKRDLLSNWIKKLYSVSKIVPNEQLFPVSG